MNCNVLTGSLNSIHPQYLVRSPMCTHLSVVKEHSTNTSWEKARDKLIGYDTGPDGQKVRPTSLHLGIYRWFDG